MRPQRTEAIVLRRTNYDEADRIITLLSPGFGKISVIAKGVRKPKSKLAGGLELMAVCDITFATGRGELGLVTSARLRHFYKDILSDYDRVTLAYDMLKKIHRATETVAEPDFYRLLKAGLGYAADLGIDWRLTEVWFLLQLQDLLGRAPNVSTSRDGRPLSADATYHFQFADQAFFADEHGRFTAEHIKLLRLAAIKNPAVVGQVGGVELVIDDCLWLVRQLEM